MSAGRRRPCPSARSVPIARATLSEVGGSVRPCVVIRRIASRLAETPIATAHLIAQEQPDRIFSLRERRQLGIKYVRTAGPTELPSTLAAAAAKDALGEDEPETIELLATATTTPSDFEMWSLPAKVAQLIGATRAACVGFAETGCAAPFAALHLMRPTMLAKEGPRRAMLVGAAVTPGRHFFAPETIVGDGAGAMLLERVSKPPPGSLRIVRSDFASDCALVDAFGCEAGAARLRDRRQLTPDDYTLRPKDAQQFRRLGERGAAAMSGHVDASLKRAGWERKDLRWLVTDNVAMQVALEVGLKLALGADRIFTKNCAQVGHLWGMELFANLSTVVNEMGVSPGDRLASVGFGLGEHYGVLLLEAC